MAESETPYAETEILMSVLRHDMDKAQEQLDDLTKTELAIFARQLGAIYTLACKRLAAKSVVNRG